jgi:hypothetical protein
MKDMSKLIRRISAVIVGIVLVVVSIVAAYNDKPLPGKDSNVMNMSIVSSSITHEHEIPARHTCDAQDTSPPISWTGVPTGAKSLVLIVDDPDAPDPAAPQMTWVHWLLYNIPVKVNGLAEGISVSNLPPGTLEGVNDWHRTGYGGPCPPVGRHRYFFKLYALDTLLPDLKNPGKHALEIGMHGHVLDQATLMGLYQRHAGR